jgi:hypothetical protein
MDRFSLQTLVAWMDILVRVIERQKAKEFPGGLRKGHVIHRLPVFE